MARVYIVGGDFLVSNMFIQEGHQIVPDKSMAHLICFTGGADVSPSLYGEKPISGTHCSPVRDKIEKIIYEYAVKERVPMVGICRGGQFLNVMNGGKMWQDVDNHCRAHWLFDEDDDDNGVFVTSTHHQMMIPAVDEETGAIKAHIVATAKEAKILRSEHLTININNKNPHEDIEVLLYEETDSLCFQPHPEYEMMSCRRWFFELLDRYALIAR